MSKPRRGVLARYGSRLTTLASLFRYFTRPERAYLAPLLLVLLIAAILLLVTGGLSYVAPFVYAIF